VSNFQCAECGTNITEGDDGHYVTFCEHWPKEESKSSEPDRGINEYPEVKV